nr:hypothetical protein GCM10020093_038590 [Planobispora longispora]
MPVHHGYPPDRMSWVMADTGAPVLVTDREPGFAHAAAVVRTDSPAVPGAGGEVRYVPEYDPNVKIHSDQLVYVIYTSGSTGTPKGVAVRHRDVLALAADHRWTGGTGAC